MAKKAPSKKTEQKKIEPKIRIKLRSCDTRILDKSCQKIIEIANQTGSIVSGPIPLPVKKKLTTVKRSPFVHEDSQEQFEMRIHSRLIDIKKPSTRTTDQLMDLDLPNGVDIEVKM